MPFAGDRAARKVGPAVLTDDGHRRGDLGQGAAGGGGRAAPGPAARGHDAAAGYGGCCCDGGDDDDAYFLPRSRQALEFVDVVLAHPAVAQELQRCVDGIEGLLDADFDRLLEMCQVDDVAGMRDVLGRSEFHASALVNRPVPGGATPVWMATCAGSTECVLALIEHKAAPFARDELGFSPLHVACELGNTAVVKALLGCVGTRGSGDVHGGHTPAGGAAVAAAAVDVEVIVNKMTGNSTFPLFNAAKNGHADIVRLLLGARARVNCLVLPEGMTALHAARESGHAAVVEILLAAGAEDLAIPAPTQWTHSTDDDDDDDDDDDGDDADDVAVDGGVDGGGDSVHGRGGGGGNSSNRRFGTSAVSPRSEWSMDGGDYDEDDDDDDGGGSSGWSKLRARLQKNKQRKQRQRRQKKEEQRRRRQKKQQQQQQRRARAASGVYGCGSREQVHVIQQEVLCKRINWSADFHERFFRLLRVVVPAPPPQEPAERALALAGALSSGYDAPVVKPAVVRFFLEFYRDRSMADLRERLEVDAESSVEVWRNRKGEGVTWKFKAGNGKRFYAKAPSIESLGSWVSKVRDIITFSRAERPMELS